MKRFLFALLILTGPAFGQVPVSKAVKTNASDVLTEPTATALWTANPLTPTFITQTSSSLLANEQALSSLSTGLLSVTTGTGLLSSVADSAALRTALSDETGTGALVFANTPTFTTPALGAATATSINGMLITSTTGGTIAIANNKTLTVSNTLTLTGTDSSSVNVGAGGTVAYTGTALSQFANTTSAQLAGIITNETGSGVLVFGTSPTLTTPNIGVATATSVNGLTIDTSTGTLDITDGKTLAVVNSVSLTGTDGSTVNFGAGGTVPYTSGTLAQFSATTSAQLAGVINNETGSGALVFGTAPTLTTPVLGVATATSINGLGITATTGTLSMTNGKTLSVVNTLSLAGTDGSTLNIGTGGTLGSLAFANSIDAADGGTGIDTYAVGDMLTANGTSSLTRIAAVATGNALISQGIAAAPVWGKITTSHTTGIAASGANNDIQSLAPADGVLDVTGSITSTSPGATDALAGTIEESSTAEAQAMSSDDGAMSPQDVRVAINSTRSIELTADDTTIAIGNERVISLSSNDATATNRTFQISGGNTGQVLTIQWDDLTDKGEFRQFSSLGVFIKGGQWFPNHADAITLTFTNSGYWAEIGRSNETGAVFSSSEIVIGQWIDGSTLYRKVVNVGALPNVGTTSDAHGISGGSFGLGSFKRIYGYAVGPSNTYAIPCDAVQIRADATNIEIIATTNFSSFSGYVTVEYTK